MNLEEAKKIFIKLGVYFHGEIGDMTVDEIFKRMKEFILLTSTSQGLQRWKEDVDAILIIKEQLEDEELNSILEKKFALIADELGEDKEYIKQYDEYVGNNRIFLQRFANALTTAIEEIRPKFL
jgi:hypothetical protein